MKLSVSDFKLYERNIKRSFLIGFSPRHPLYLSLLYSLHFLLRLEIKNQPHAQYTHNATVSTDTRPRKSGSREFNFKILPFPLQKMPGRKFKPKI
jgi:hypothetical protein